MPRPLPWFDNLVDPLLPSGSTFSLKSLVYKYDDYQTYDVVAWQKVTPRLDRTIHNNFAVKNLYSPRVFGEPQTILFDKFTPDNHAWCDEYSQKVYEFVKLFSHTDYYRSFITHPENLPINSGSEVISFPLAVFNIPTSIVINSTVDTVITWMELETETEDYREYTKKYQLIKKGNNTIKYNPTAFLLCSMVCPNNDINKQLIKLSSGLLYSNLDTFIDVIIHQILTAFPRLFKLVKSVTYTVQVDIQYALNYDPGALGLNPTRVVTPYNQTKTPLNAVYIDRPKYLHSACFIPANNNAWGNGNVLNDVGRVPLFDITGRTYLNKQRLGFFGRGFFEFLPSGSWHSHSFLNGEDIYWRFGNQNDTPPNLALGSFFYRVNDLPANPIAANNRNPATGVFQEVSRAGLVTDGVKTWSTYLKVLLD